ncbi:hypothetical protein CJF42_06830 [Pseudoalteromonas sp. NBT06-2]|uniref:hypothetical protein n=1 Tax=Pseudoalteromonas sp. NBT06-2 TaxID=2025950 RepID=UPI000BA5211D|nr:hypothetical protein [Pseudoalteromonas sp. NBT06-2]PAJ75197.1 hypothetical protein CJF42_06830 [Pseudoalteromonas sp. NBT06-2]
MLLALDDSFKSLGILTITDLLRQKKSAPVQLIGRIYKANSAIVLKRYAIEIPELLHCFPPKVEGISIIGIINSIFMDV